MTAELVGGVFLTGGKQLKSSSGLGKCYTGVYLSGFCFFVVWSNVSVLSCPGGVPRVAIAPVPHLTSRATPVSRWDLGERTQIYMNIIDMA